jgi:uncharacterized phage-associated protein
MTQKVLDISHKIIDACTDRERGNIISNLKLQKMLYYMHGFHLAFFIKTFFDDDIIAWQYGPVVPEIYRKFSLNGAAALSLPDNTKIVWFDNDTENMFRQVVKEYGQFSAVKLMEMTHEETPWKTTEMNQIISKNKLKRYFLTQVEED